MLIQLDVGAQQVNGRLLVIEATTGELSLPRELQGLDPQSGASGGTYDWSALDERNASHRKWMQIIKVRAAALYVTRLGNAWGHSVVSPDLVLRVSRATAPARRAAEAMGFRVEETGESWPEVE